MMGQFEVLLDGHIIAKRGGNFFTRQFGAGYPDFDDVILRLEREHEQQG
jgi:hypothetical protein